MLNMKKIVAAVCVIDVILLALCVWIYVGKDRTAPTITLGDNQIQYSQGMDMDLLLEGVTAYDPEDGDVTASLLVEKIGNVMDGEVMVTYIARDSSNNVAKAYRAVKVK